MKKILMLAAAIAATAPACAEWIQFTSSTEGDKHFFDPNTYQARGNVRRVWTLIEYVRPDQKGILSAKSLWDVDCAEGRHRILQATVFRGSMGSGGSDSATDPRPSWMYIEPGSTGAGLQRVICKLPAQ